MYNRLATALLLASAASASAQSERAITAADYTRAEKYLGTNVSGLVLNSGVRPTWLPDGRFWYRVTTADGAQYVTVDPARKTANRSKNCDAAVHNCTAEQPQRPGGAADATRNASVSPDGKRAVFIRDYNLWVRELANGQEKQLTTDGVKDFGYATDNAGWTRSDRAIALWSPDSKKVATYQQDERKVGEMHMVSTAVGHPTVQSWKYPLPGDSVIQMIHRVVIDVESGTLVRFKLPADAHRSTVCDHIVCGGRFADVQWFDDASKVAFVSSTRDHKQANLRIADANTGDIRDVLEERVATQYESGYGNTNWQVLPATNEVIWFSERDDWGNLYLYDLATGKLKHKITSGPGAVLRMLRVDDKTRTIYFVATGKEAGRDPYFRHLYRVGLDGRNQKLLTPENADHDVTLSPDGKYFTDSYSTPVTPPTAVLRDTNGALLLSLEKADISRLLATGWTPPIPITVKARDGKTDLYGLMYRPTQFDSTKKYPIINSIYPGPQSGSVGGYGSRAFNPARGDTRALSELGFVVVQIDAMGTPQRSKSFHDAYYGNMGDNGLPDHITGMKQLAQRHAWIDIDKVGIYGHSGGGFASADAIMRYPDFFKVAVSQAGNHDNRTYEDDWGERYHGLLTRNADGTTNYDDQANQNLAKNLKGKLLLAHGTLDGNVPPNNTLMLVNELIKHNKDFDLIMMPNRGHGFGGEAYMTRRRWDYFVKHLMGAEPPKEFQIGRPVS